MFLFFLVQSYNILQKAGKQHLREEGNSEDELRGAQRW